MAFHREAEDSTENDMAKQLTARNIAEDFGETSRHWTKMAEAGLVPGASRPSGKAPWLFDVAVFKAWIEAGQPAIPKPVYVKPSKSPSPRLDAEPRRKAKSLEIDLGIAALVRGALKGR